MHVSLEPGGLVVDTPNAICARRTWKIITRMAGERDDTETRKSDITSQKHSKLLKRYRILPSFARNRDHVYQNNTNSEPSRNLRSNWEGISVNVFSYSFFGHDLCHGLAIPYGRKFISIYQSLYIGFDTCR